MHKAASSRQRKKGIKRLLSRPLEMRGSLLLALVFFYFAFHLVSGDRGLIAYVRLKNEYENARLTSDALAEEKKSLNHKVALIRSESLDLDIVDEVARENLGYSAPNEVVYFVRGRE